MKWSIIQLQKFRDKGFPIDETVDLNDIKEIDPQVIEVSPIHVTGRADIGSNRVTFHLHIEGNWFFLAQEPLSMSIYQSTSIRLKRIF